MKNNCKNGNPKKEANLFVCPVVELLWMEFNDHDREKRII